MRESKRKYVCAGKQTEYVCAGKQTEINLCVCARKSGRKLAIGKSSQSTDWNLCHAPCRQLRASGNNGGKGGDPLKPLGITTVWNFRWFPQTHRYNAVGFQRALICAPMLPRNDES